METDHCKIHIMIRRMWIIGPKLEKNQVLISAWDFKVLEVFLASISKFERKFFNFHTLAILIAEH